MLIRTCCCWFAGHGYTVRDEGYIVPVDAPSPKADADFREKAISLPRLGEYICFSAAVFNVAPPRCRPRDHLSHDRNAD
jgi:hypothetical protein